MWTEFWTFLTPPPPLVDRHGFLANPPRKPCGVLEDPPPSSDSNFFRFFANFCAILVICGCIFFTKFQIVIVHIKTPNSSNSTAFSAVQGVPRQSVRLYTIFLVGYKNIYGILWYIVCSKHHTVLLGWSFNVSRLFTCLKNHKKINIFKKKLKFCK